MFINTHVIKYRPEQGEDLLRISIDENVHTRLYKLSDFENNRDTASVLAMSHDKLGSDVSEMVATDLSHMTDYAILIIYAQDEFEMESKSEEECLIATMQVKIANSDS